MNPKTLIGKSNYLFLQCEIEEFRHYPNNFGFQRPNSQNLVLDNYNCPKWKMPKTVLCFDYT